MALQCSQASRYTGSKVPEEIKSLTGAFEIHSRGQNDIKDFKETTEKRER